MTSRCARLGPALLFLGYALLFAVHFAETAYALPRTLNPDAYGMVQRFFLAGLQWAPLRWVACGPCQRWTHLNVTLFVPAVLLMSLGYAAALRAVQCRPQAWPFARLLGGAALAALPLLAI